MQHVHNTNIYIYILTLKYVYTCISVFGMQIFDTLQGTQPAFFFKPFQDLRISSFDLRVLASDPNLTWSIFVQICVAKKMNNYTPVN